MRWLTPSGHEVDLRICGQEEMRVESLNQEIDRMLQGLEHPYRELTQWEEDFVAHMQELRDADRTLNDNQLDKLREIFEAKA